MRVLLSSLLLAATLGSAPGQQQQQPAPPSTPDAARRMPPEVFDKPQIVVHVEGRPELTVTAADLKGMPRHQVTAHEHGNAVEYEGVYLHDVLAKAGAPFGNQLKGKALASYVPP